MAGANNSLIYFNAEGINEMKGNEQPIGKYLSDEAYNDHRLDGTKIS
ncbi:MAG: hypothetical protein ACK4GL_09460 [Flavobacteriales bacterium]